jgi:hypothetical protein
MQFVNPIWLWGLAGLLIPIGIHLLSRKAGNVIRFGSVRHLDNTNTRRFKSIQLNESALLILRCLIIICLVFLLSGLHFDSFGKKSKWLLIDKGLGSEQKFVILIDSLAANGFEIRSFSSGFPLLKDSAITERKTDYWTLLDELRTKPIEQAIVLANNYITGFKGKRTILPDHVQWLSKDPDSNNYVANAVESSNDSIAIRIGKSDEVKTSFLTYKIGRSDANFAPGLNSVTVESPDTISLAIVYDSAFAYDKNITLAALEAIQKKTPATLTVETLRRDLYSQGAGTDWVVWLCNTQFTGTNKNRICLSESVNEDLLVLTSNVNGVFHWRLTKRLNEEIALRDHLAIQLALILAPTERYNDRIDESDRRILPEEIRWRQNHGTMVEAATIVNTRPGERLMAFALLALLFVERLLAFKKGQ